MKPILLALGISLAFLPAARAGDCLWDTFDAYPPGSIAAQPGWIAAPWLNTQTAQVSAARFYSPSNALELAWHASGSSAVFTNFDSTYAAGAEHPVIRWSTRLFLENTNTIFQFGLRNSSSGDLFYLWNHNGYASLGFTHIGASAFPLPVGRFADLTAWYNRSNNTYRLDIDGTNVLPWTLSDFAPVVVTRFNQFAVTRLNSSTSTTGQLFIDNAAVETFPPHVWAWWRCTAVTEQLGTFAPASPFSFVSQACPGASDPVWDGSSDAHNEGATSYCVMPPAECIAPTPSSTNWTVEAVFNLAPDSGNTSFLDWGKEHGFDTNGAWISFGYFSTPPGFYFELRDDQQLDGVYVYAPLGSFIPNGRWHHAALVKSNTTASLYFDYQFVTSLVLSAEADGAYAFNTATRACVGRTLNGGNECGLDSIIDEVRFSGKALALSEFLQPGQPMIVDIANSATNATLELTAKCILGKAYHVETSPALGPAANWQTIPGSAFTSSYTFMFFDVPTTLNSNFVRAVREKD